MQNPTGRQTRQISVKHKIKYYEFAARLQNLMSYHGMNREDMVRALGCTDAIFVNYYNGWKLPSGKYLDKIADMLGVTVDDLLYGRHKKEKPKSIEVQQTLLKS
jgi:transcriptional regulator with XRE-family HTH domain